MTMPSDEARFAHKIAFNSAHDTLASTVRKIESLSVLLQCALENPDEPNIGIGITELLDGIAVEIGEAMDTSMELWTQHSIDQLSAMNDERLSA